MNSQLIAASKQAVREKLGGVADLAGQELAETLLSMSEEASNEAIAGLYVIDEQKIFDLMKPGLSLDLSAEEVKVLRARLSSLRFFA